MVSFEEPVLALEHDMSPVKKERLKRLQKEMLRKKFRESLPVLNKQQIRKHRLPYHESLLADLEDNGFVNSAEFIKQLIELQERTRKKSGPGTVVWLRPQLKYSKSTLDVLVKCLTTAETAHNEDKVGLEWDEMLHLAAQYAFGSEDWWWLGEQLLYQCVSIEYPDEFNKQEAIAYFIIGKYLVEKGKKMEPGRYYLDLARVMSKGKSWTCSKILGKRQDIVFIESCRLLYSVLIEEAVLIMKTDPKKALEICNVARKRAAEACDHNNEYEASLLRGRCELLLNRSLDAIATVLKTLHRTVRRGFVKGICEAKIALALAYLQ